MPRKFSEFDADNGPSISVEVVGVDPNEADPALQNIRIPLAYLKGRTYAAVDEKPIQEPIVALFFGDSNCYGYAGSFNNENAPTQPMVQNDRVFVWQGPHSGTGSGMVPDAPASFGWVVADPNRSSEWELGALFCGMKGFGGDPAWSWANNTQIRTGRDVYLFKLTQGGMLLSLISPPSGAAYSHYIAHATAALAAVPNTRGVADFEFCMLGAADAGDAGAGPGTLSAKEWMEAYQARRGDADNPGGIIDQPFIDEDWTQFVLVGQPQRWDWWKGSQMAANNNNGRTRFIGYRPMPMYDIYHPTGDGYIRWGEMASGVTLEPPTEQNDYPSDSGSLTWRHTNTSDVPDTPTAVAFKFDTDKDLATAGQRLFEFKNLGADRVYAEVDGGLVATGSVTTVDVLATGNVFSLSGNIQANTGDILAPAGNVDVGGDIDAGGNIESVGNVIANGQLVGLNILGTGAITSLNTVQANGKLIANSGVTHKTSTNFANAAGTAVALDDTYHVIYISNTLTSAYTFSLPDAAVNEGLVYVFVCSRDVGLGATINVTGDNFWYDEFPTKTAITVANNDVWTLRALDPNGGVNGVWSRSNATP